MAKHKLTEEEKKELFHIATREGYNKAFLKLIDFAVDKESLIDSDSPVKCDVKVGFFLEQHNLTMEDFLNIFKSYMKISNEVYAYDTDCTIPERLETYKQMIDEMKKCEDAIPHCKVFDCLREFDFYGLQQYLYKLHGKTSSIGDLRFSIEDLLKDALRALVCADCGDGVYFYFGNFLAINVPGTESYDPYLKLVYALEESTNDW